VKTEAVGKIDAVLADEALVLLNSRLSTASV
jgi:hypothetical protein